MFHLPNCTNNFNDTYISKLLYVYRTYKDMKTDIGIERKRESHREREKVRGYHKERERVINKEREREKRLTMKERIE